MKNSAKKYLMFGALAIGGVAAFSVYKINRFDPHEKIVEAIAKEKNEKPMATNELEQAERNPAAVQTNDAVLKKMNQLEQFSKTEFSEPQSLFKEVEVLAKDILKSSISQSDKADLNNRLHNIVSQKVEKLKIPKVVSVQLDAENNLVKPVFESTQ